MHKITISTTITEENLLFIKEKGFKISAVLDSAVRRLREIAVGENALEDEVSRRKAYQKNFENLKDIFIKKHGEAEFFKIWRINV